MEQEILFERVERDGNTWAEITLNRPDKGNALTMPMLDQLRELAVVLEKDRDVRVVVIRARGRFFCTGGDVAAWGALAPDEMARDWICLLYTSPSPRDLSTSRMPSSA